MSSFAVVAAAATLTSVKQTAFKSSLPFFANTRTSTRFFFGGFSFRTIFGSAGPTFRTSHPVYRRNIIHPNGPRLHDGGFSNKTVCTRAATQFPVKNTTENNTILRRIRSIRDAEPTIPKLRAEENPCTQRRRISSTAPSSNSTNGGKGATSSSQNNTTTNATTTTADTSNHAQHPKNGKTPTFWEWFLGPKEMPKRYTFAWYREMVLICTVFGITGSSTMLLVRPAVKDILRIDGTFWDGPWSYRICSIVIMSPIYATLLVIVGTVFGRHAYFRQFTIKIFSRFGIPPEMIDQNYHLHQKTFRKW